MEMQTVTFNNPELDSEMLDTSVCALALPKYTVMKWVLTPVCVLTRRLPAGPRQRERKKRDKRENC